MQDETITIAGEEYEFVPEEARILTQYLFKLHKKLGIPDDLTADAMNDAAWRFVMEVIGVWKLAYPHEYYTWISDLEIELKYERPVRESIKKGGYFPISYPSRVFHLLKVFCPKLQLQDKKFIKGMVWRVPELKHTNFKI